MKDAITISYWLLALIIGAMMVLAYAYGRVEQLFKCRAGGGMLDAPMYRKELPHGRIHN